MLKLNWNFLSKSCFFRIVLFDCIQWVTSLLEFPTIDPWIIVLAVNELVVKVCAFGHLPLILILVPNCIRSLHILCTVFCEKSLRNRGTLTLSFERRYSFDLHISNITSFARRSCIGMLLRNVFWSHPRSFAIWSDRTFKAFELQFWWKCCITFILARAYWSLRVICANRLLDTWIFLLLSLVVSFYFLSAFSCQSFRSWAFWHRELLTPISLGCLRRWVKFRILLNSFFREVSVYIFYIPCYFFSHLLEVLYQELLILKLQFIFFVLSQLRFFLSFLYGSLEDWPEFLRHLCQIIEDIYDFGILVFNCWGFYLFGLNHSLWEVMRLIFQLLMIKTMTEINIKTEKTAQFYATS